MKTITVTMVGIQGTYKAKYPRYLWPGLAQEIRVLEIEDNSTGEILYYKEV